MFTSDSRTERFLDSFGVKWKYANDIAFVSMASGWESSNLGRSQITIDQAIREYGALMDRGSAAPAPILWRNAAIDRFEVIDGLQRLMAARSRGATSFSAYIAETDSVAMVKKLRVFANYRLQGGYQESAEWTLGQVIDCLINPGTISIEEACDLGGWSPAVVRDKRDVMACGFNVRRVGGPDKLPDSLLRIVGKHSQRADFDASPAPLGDFFRDIQTMRLSAEDAAPYIEEFFAVPRSKGRLHEHFAEKLRAFRADEDVALRLADPTRRRFQPSTAEGRLMRSLKAALTTAERVLASGERIPFVDDYFRVLGQINGVVQKIKSNSRKASR